MTDPLAPPSPTAPAAARWARAALPLALLVGVAAALLWPTRECARCFSSHYDWRYFQAMEEVFRVTVAEYHQVPLWNPYACGGEVGLANPQSTALAPTLVLSLLLGTAVGVKVALFVYLLMALLGGYALARAFGASVPSALVAGVAYGGSGWFTLHLSTGHINFAGAALYPYLVLAYLHAVDRERRRSWRFAIPAGLLIAWMAALGGTYTVPMAVVLLGALAASDVIRERTPRPLLVLLAIGAVALAVGAARFFPLLEFVRDHPRHVPEKDANNALDVARMFLAWRQRLESVGGHVYWWHEYCCHLPYLALLLAAYAALHKAGLRRARTWGPAAVFIVWTALALLLPALDRRIAQRVLFYRDAYHLLGAGSLLAITWRTPVARFVPAVVVALGIVVGAAWPHGPWWLIRMLPLFRDLRVPARYLILVALVLSLWAALGMDALVARLRARRGAGVAALVAVALVALVVGETLAFDWPAWADSRFDTPRAPARPGARFYQVEGEWREMLTVILARHGVLKCDEEAPLQRGELDPGDVEQVRLVDPGAGEARLVDWTPNVLTLETRLDRETDVLVNENWNEHWIAEGAVVRNVAGRLAARPPTGHARFTLRYRPRSFIAGAWVTAITLPLALLLLLSLPRTRPRVRGQSQRR